MEKQAVKEIALACGFKLNQQSDGTMDLNPCVYEFADQLLSRVRHGQEMINLCRARALTDALYLLHIGERDSNTMEIAQALDIVCSVQKELINSPQPHTDTEQVGRMVQLELPLDMPPAHDALKYASSVEVHLTNEQEEELNKLLSEEPAYGSCCVPHVTVHRDRPVSAAEHDPVNHPSHYTSHPSGVEAIEITRHMGFNLGNAMKYLWRNGLKDGQPAVQDLEKAIWYIQDEIKRLKQSL